MSRPIAVRVFDQALADWLSSFTMPEELAAEMADACADGAPWAAAIGAVAARRVGWPDAEAVAWGLCVGGCGGALEAARRSLATEETLGAVSSRPAVSLLAADGLIAAAHETLGSLAPERARAALAALGRAFGDGGPWRALSASWPAPGWAAVVPCALDPAARAEPDGPWPVWADAWQAAHGAPAPGDGRPGRSVADDRALWDHPAADPDTKALLRAAARAAAAPLRDARV